jgi:hypothetical protein
MDLSLSDDDIKKFIPNVIVYSDLAKYSLEDLIKSMPLVVLYQTTHNTGHWTLLHLTPEGVEFFDSYSSMPDEEFKVMEKQQPHYLAKLLYQLSKITNINYNTDQLQEINPNINTCGRWVILRHLMNKYSIDDFVYGVKEVSEALGISPDELVTSIITLKV